MCLHPKPLLANLVKGSTAGWWRLGTVRRTKKGLDAAQIYLGARSLSFPFYCMDPQELTQANEELVLRLDRLREEFTRIHTKLRAGCSFGQPVAECPEHALSFSNV